MDENFIMMPIPAKDFRAVCALLGGAAIAVAQSAPGNASSGVAAPATAPATVGSEISAPANQESAGTGPNASQPAVTASPSDGIDAHGHPWSADLHASTKGKTKDGLWRMKVGVSRPDPLPGFPKDDASAGTGTSPATDTPSATSPTATAPGNGQPDTSGDDDEFAAFRAAAAASDATDQAAAASVPPRQYSDADLGQLCNQAAVKLGDPNPVKEIIARFVPEGQVAHSRNIPADKRTDFVSAVEERAGIQFAG